MNSDASSWKFESVIPTRRNVKSIVALILTFTAGFVDIVGLLTIYKVFTAHITGTTVRLGEQLMRGNWSAVAVAATVVAAFLLGSICGRVIIEVGAHTAFRRIASTTFLLELLLLMAVPLWGSDALYRQSQPNYPVPLICALLAMLAAAMGLQTATLTRIGPLTIHTTFVTGMINKLAELLSKWIFLVYDNQRSVGSRKTQLRYYGAKTLRRAAFIFAIWVLYLVGAVCGTWLGLRLGLEALLVPCVILAFAIVADQFRPLAWEEEKEQSQA